MKPLSLALFAFLTAVAAPAFANEEGKDHAGRDKHYEVEAPKTTADALAMLDGKIKEIEGAYKKNELEGIHERSYYLEAAVDKLREDANDKTRENAVDTLDEQVQAMHYASENGKHDQVKADLPKLKSAAAKVEKAFKKS